MHQQKCRYLQNKNDPAYLKMFLLFWPIINPPGGNEPAYVPVQTLQDARLLCENVQISLT